MYPNNNENNMLKIDANKYAKSDGIPKNSKISTKINVTNNSSIKLKPKATIVRNIFIIVSYSTYLNESSTNATYSSSGRSCNS